MGPFNKQQLQIMLVAMDTEKERIRTDRRVRPSIRALMMADCAVIINAVREELDGTRSESNHPSGEEH